MTMEDPWEHMRVRFVAPSADRSIHTIYCRKHAVRQSSTEFPLGRTVFCVGWPPYSTEDGVRDLFARVGQVMSVHLRAQPGGERDHATSRGGFLVCYVVFSEASETESAMKLCASSQPLHCATGPVGLSKWASQYQQAYRDERLLEAKLEAQIAEYDLWTKEDAKRKHLLAQPNEEGWITVGREGSSARKCQQKKKELTNFYTFQRRDRQRVRVAQLRKKFEADKKRIADLRAQRKFRPF